MISAREKRAKRLVVGGVLAILAGLTLLPFLIIWQLNFGMPLIWMPILTLTGIVLFCGSIYATTFGAPASVGSMAPIGGLAFMLGWLSLGVGVATIR